MLVSAALDGAGDGWVELLLPRTSAPPPFVGFHVGRLAMCVGPGEPCADVAVFGGAGGAAERAGLLVSAGHAFVHDRNLIGREENNSSHNLSQRT